MDAEAVRDFYDERYRGDYMARHPELEQVRVRDVLGSVPGDVERVLDYGCGSGILAIGAAMQ